MSILAEIFAHKRAEVDRWKQIKPLPDVRDGARSAPPPVDFIAGLRIRRDRGVQPFPALIAEVKQRSPSRGVLIQVFDPLRLAGLFRENGAAAISVLTDERYFGGHLDHLRQIAAQEPRLPVLRKDFICDPYQVYEARAAGADAILLIAAMLPPGLLSELHALALELQMAPLVEIHTREELQDILPLQPVLVGINNRDLHDFTVRLETSLSLRPEVPPGVMVVAESGIHTPQDVLRLAAAGVDAILVGEALVTAPDVAEKVRSLADAGILLQEIYGTDPDQDLRYQNPG